MISLSAMDVATFSRWYVVSSGFQEYFMGNDYNWIRCMYELNEVYNGSANEYAVHNLLNGLLENASDVSCNGKVLGRVSFLLDFLDRNWREVVHRKKPNWISEHLADLADMWVGNAAPYVTARPSLDPLTMYQMYLAMAWSNWTSVPLHVGRVHTISSVTMAFKVSFDGGVEEDSAHSGSTTREEALYNKIVSSRDMKQSDTSGEWSNNGETFSGSYTIPVDEELLEALEVPRSEVEAWCSSKSQAWGEKRRAAEDAYNVLIGARWSFIYDFENYMRDRDLQNIWRNPRVDVNGWAFPTQTAQIHSEIYTYSDCQEFANMIYDAIINWVDSARNAGSLDVSKEFSVVVWIVGSHHPEYWYIIDMTDSIRDYAEAAARAQFELGQIERELNMGYPKDITGILANATALLTPTWDGGKEPHDPNSEPPITVSVTASLTTPSTSPSDTTVYFFDPLEIKELKWPATCLLGSGSSSGYVASETAVVAYAFKDDNLYDYRKVGNSYVKGRTPTGDTYAILDVEKKNTSISSVTPYDLAETIAKRAVNRVNQLPVSGTSIPSIPLGAFTIIWPSASPGVVSSASPHEPESLYACGGPYTAYYRCPDDPSGSSSSPSEVEGYEDMEDGVNDDNDAPRAAGDSSDNIRPYMIVNGSGAVVWTEGDGSITVCFRYSDDAHSATVNEMDEITDGITINNSDHMALRVAWNWKSMPFEP